MKHVFLFCGTVIASIAAATGAFAQNDNPTGPAGIFNGNSTTEGSYDPYTANATRAIVDLSVPGAVGAYPLVWTRTMNSRHVAGPSYDFGEAGSWQHSYNWGADGGISNAPQPASYTIYYPDGRVVIFAPRTSATVDPNYRGPAGVADRFQPVANSGYCYLLLADGGKVQFYQTATRTVEQGPARTLIVAWEFTLTPLAVIDPFGQRTSLTWDEVNGHVTQVTEPAGHWLKISYGTPITGGYPVITSVQAGYDSTVTQSVTYSYSGFAVGGYTYTTLTGVSYSDGTSASYTYQAANTYPNTGPPLIQTCNDVRYAGPMKKIAYEFAAQANEGYGGIYGEFAIARHWLYPEPAAVSYWLGGHVETRGDGPQRAFFYGANSSRPAYIVPQPYLLSQSTDFKGYSSYLGYDQNTYVNTFEDANGNTTNFTRTFTGKPITIVHPPDATGVRSSIQLSYTDGVPNPGLAMATGLPPISGTVSTPGTPQPSNPTQVYGYYSESVTDELGHTTAYQRDGNNRVKEIDYPDTGTETFTYNNLGEVLTHKMTSGGIETFDYDGRGLKQSYRDAYHQFYGDNPTSRYQYDSLDRLSGVTDARGVGTGDPNYTTNYGYNQRGQLTTLTYPTDANTGQRYTKLYAYNGDSTLASATDERGSTTSYAYDDYKRLASVTPPLAYVGDNTARTTNYYYDHTGGTGVDYTHTDSHIRLVVTPLGNRTAMQYNGNFWKSAVTAGSGAEASTTTYNYDFVGNLKAVTQPYNQGYTTFTYFYDARNRLTDVDDVYNRNLLGHTVSWTYDQASNKKTQLRANNQLITYDQYDPMNRLQAQSVQRDTNVIDQTAMTYDSAGNLATFADGRQKVYTYTYDYLNRKSIVQFPTDDRGIATTERYYYDQANNLYFYLDRAGAAETLTYDNRNRQTQFSWNVVPLNTHGDRSLSYDPVGNVVHVAAGVDTIDCGYDFRNRKTSEAQHWGGIQTSHTIGYSYDADSKRKTMTYPSGLVLTYNYNTRNQLVSESDGNGAIVSYAYDLNGKRTARTLHNGTKSVYARDLEDLPSEIRHERGSSEFASVGYSYDEVNRIYWRERDYTRGEYYTYYLDDQLKSATFDAALINDPTPPNASSFAYDGNGNRTSQTSRSTPSYTYGANDLNEYNSVNNIAPTYDAKGNLTQFNGTQFGYDAQNRVVVANSLNFYYDGLGRQIARLEDGQWVYSIWDGWDLIEEYTVSNALIHGYVHGAATDEMVERFGGGAQTIWYYQDAQGNTTHLADDAGNVLEQYNYDSALAGAPSIYTAYGQQISASTYGNRFLYSGRDWLKQAGIYDYRNRFYLPSLGRFLQSDPIGFSGDARNLYRYGGGDPVNNSDPMGTNPIAMDGGIGDGRGGLPDSVRGAINGDNYSSLTLEQAEFNYSNASYAAQQTLGIGGFLGLAQIHAYGITPAPRALPVSNRLGVLGAGGAARNGKGAIGNYALIKLLNGLGGTAVYRDYLSTAVSDLAAMGYSTIDLIGYSRGGIVMVNTAWQFPNLSFNIIGIDPVRIGIPGGSIPLPSNVISATDYYQQNPHDYGLGSTGNSFIGTPMQSDYIPVTNVSFTGNLAVDHGTIVATVSEQIVDSWGGGP